MKDRSSGKVLAIILVIVSILLLSSTILFGYIWQKEVDTRVMTENMLRKSEANEQLLEADLKLANKQNFLLEEKHKEADEQINNLLDEVELEKGIREEMKQEITSLKNQVESEAGNKTIMNSALQMAEQKVTELEVKLKSELSRYEEAIQTKVSLEAKTIELEEEIKQLSSLSPMREAPSIATKTQTQAQSPPQDLNVELEPIVVVPEHIMKELPQVDIPGEKEFVQVKDMLPPLVDNKAIAKKIQEKVDSPGRILSVDVETEFVIVNLGGKDGVRRGQVLSVFRGPDYLGDIKVTRVQPEMSAADFIPPFSSRRVRKNDKVVLR